ncbi:MAG: hypothetical protein PWP23_832 [Candidatus Sumerlaeota bacterium]|nr:hypothetical protein [Candidatus Sumerlaeota bacterium]
MGLLKLSANSKFKEFGNTYLRVDENGAANHMIWHEGMTARRAPLTNPEPLSHSLIHGVALLAEALQLVDQGAAADAERAGRLRAVEPVVA